MMELLTTFAFVDEPPGKPAMPGGTRRFLLLAATCLGAALATAGVVLRRHR
jgi:hypothetical protein